MASVNANGTLDSIFYLGRFPPLPSLYGDNKTAVTSDVLEIGWVVAFCVLYVSLLLFVPAKDCKEKIYYILRMTVIVFVGFAIMWCNFGQEWEVGEIESKMFYKAGSHEEIKAKIGIKLGLRSVNITLKATEPPRGQLQNETIDYNERFTWIWDQGRAGFGPFAGRIQMEYREAQLRGLPYPILWVAEYFTFDGEGLRFGRRYRHAGWFAHICIWTAFPVWILTILMIKLVIRYGGILLCLLGSLLITSSLIWCSVRNFNELAVIFNDNENTGVLRTHYGLHWYVSLIVGILCLTLGILIFVLDYNFHTELCNIFGVNPLAVLDESYVDVIEPEPMKEENGAMEMQPTKNKISRTTSKVVFRARGTTKNWKTTQLNYMDQQLLLPDQQYYPNQTDQCYYQDTSADEVVDNGNPDEIIQWQSEPAEVLQQNDPMQLHYETEQQQHNYGNEAYPDDPAGQLSYPISPQYQQEGTGPQNDIPPPRPPKRK